MTNEELVELMKEVSEEMAKLPDDSEKPLTKQEKNRRLVLRLRMETLNRIKEAKEKANLSQEIKAGTDYVLLTKYGEKHPFLMNFIRAQIGWFCF